MEFHKSRAYFLNFSVFFIRLTNTVRIYVAHCGLCQEPWFQGHGFDS